MRVRLYVEIAWSVVVFPALLVNYLGQGAVLLRSAAMPANLFYALAPAWFVYPLVVLATLATVIASQAVISGAFSLARQAVQLGFWPRIRIVHTSSSSIGQVYLPFINLTLCVVTILLVLWFRHSGNLASAYGIAVSATMLITSVLIILLPRRVWNAPRAVVLLVGGGFLALDLVLVSANVSKLLSGGWIVVLLAVLVGALMLTWMTGRRILLERVLDESLPIEQFVEQVPNHNPARIQRTAVFLSGNVQCVPRALLHNYKHNGVLHAQTLIVSVMTEETPFVPAQERGCVAALAHGFHTVLLRFGFMESPDIPCALAACGIATMPPDTGQLSYFLGKESLVLTHTRGMAFWRKTLFRFLARNELNASSFFNLPANRVVELGEQIQL